MEQCDHAYVTLRSGSDCGGFTDELQVVDVSNPSDPREEKSYELEDPHGLDIKGSELYVCDGDGGLLSFDASNTPQLDEEQSFGDIHGYDAIALSQTLIVVGDDWIHQYDREEELQKLSEIPVHGN